jgi:Tc5 transposase C-terminal domain
MDEWMESSIRGERCGIVGCQNPPTNKCPKCGRHYCYDHFVHSHRHVLTDKEVEENKRRQEELR